MARTSYSNVLSLADAAQSWNFDLIFPQIPGSNGQQKLLTFKCKTAELPSSKIEPIGIEHEGGAHDRTAAAVEPFALRFGTGIGLGRHLGNLPAKFRFGGITPFQFRPRGLGPVTPRGGDFEIVGDFNHAVQSRKFGHESPRQLTTRHVAAEVRRRSSARFGPGSPPPYVGGYY